MLGRHRLGEDRLARGVSEAGEIFADGEAARLAGLGREAEVPFGVVLDARGHVDDDRAGEAGGGRSGQDMPEHGGAERPANPDRAVEVERVGQIGDVGRELLDRRPFAALRRFAMAAQVDGDDAMVAGKLRLGAEEAAMRHQPVQQHDRRAGADIAISDSRPVRSGEALQQSLPTAIPAPVRGSCGVGGYCLKLKPESMFKFA